MNPETDARAPKRATPRRRTIGAVAVGSLALAGVAVLPFTGAMAATTELTFTNGAAGAIDLALYPVDATGNFDPTRVGGVRTLANQANGLRTVNAATASAAGIVDGTAYKILVRGNATNGLQARWYDVATTPSSTPGGDGAVRDYGAGTVQLQTNWDNAEAVTIDTVNDAAPLDFGGTELGTITLVADGANDPTVAVTSIDPIDDAGVVQTGGSLYPGQRARLTATVSGGTGTPSGLVTLGTGDFTLLDSASGTLGATGVATLDVVVTGNPGSARTVTVNYSGDADRDAKSATKSDVVIASGQGTLAGALTSSAGPAAASATVRAYSTPATGNSAVVDTVTADSRGRFWMTIPDGTYKLNYAVANHVTEWDIFAGGIPSATDGVPTFADVSDANRFTVASNRTAGLLETLTATGTTAVEAVITPSDTTPFVGQPISVEIDFTGGPAGTVNIEGAPVNEVVALNGTGEATLSYTPTASGVQAIEIEFSGNGTNPIRTYSTNVSVVAGGAALVGKLTQGGANVDGTDTDDDEVFVYRASDAALVAAVDTNATGDYSVGLVPGDYKVRFANDTPADAVDEWNNDKLAFSEADVITVGSSPVTANATLTVLQAGGVAPTVVGTPSATSVTSGESFTVTVKVTGGTGAPTGTVRRSSDTDVRNIQKLNAAGEATFTITNPTANFSDTFVYSGSATLQMVTSAAVNVTVKPASSTSLSVNPMTAISGKPVTLTALVLDNNGTGVTSGTVTFKNGAAVIGTDATATNGVFTATVSNLPLGTSSITAEYGGTATLSASTSTTAMANVIASAGTLEPVDPTRVLQPTSVGAAGTTTITFAGATAPPAGATAVKLNVTVSGVQQTTYVSACAGGTAVTTCDDSSAINSSGDDLRNFVIVPLGTGANLNQVTLYNNAGTVNLSADLMGWVVNTTSTTSGVFAAYNPVRITDNPVLIGQGGATTVTLDNVPAGATAVAVNVTVAGVTGNTFVSGCAWGTPSDDCNSSSIINSNGQDRANMAIIPLGGTLKNKLRFYNNAGQTQLILDLQGYVLGSAGTGSDGRYQSVTPTRVIEPTSIAQEEFKTFKLTGVPAGATAVALNLTAAGVKANTYFSACPSTLANASCSSTSVLNSKGPDTAGFVIVKLGGAANDEVKIYNNLGSNLIIADLQGWVIG